MFWSGLLLITGSLVLVFLKEFGGDFLDKTLKLSLPHEAVVFGAIILIFTGVFLIIGSSLLSFFASLRANKKILLLGQPAEAAILALADTGTRINNNPVVNCSLEVCPPSQPPFRVEVRAMVSLIHLPSYQPGKIVNVKYIPGTNEVAVVGAKID